MDIGAKPEISRKRTVFFPSVTATGTGFRKAYWDFYPKAGDYLHADKELHLLVNGQRPPVTAGVTVRAKVRFRGLRDSFRSSAGPEGLTHPVSYGSRSVQPDCPLRTSAYSRTGRAARSSLRIDQRVRAPRSGRSASRRLLPDP